MERQSYWYSVVQFQPDVIRGEKINVGLIMHNPLHGKFSFKLIDDDNVKVKSFTSDATRLRQYRANKDFIEYVLLHTGDNALNLVGEIQLPASNDENYLNLVTQLLPDSITLSEPTFVKTRYNDEIFQTLLKQYVGEQFLRSESKPQSTKQFVKQLFEEKQWMGIKIKSNITIRPSKQLPVAKARIDFVFKNEVWHLIQTLPNNEERLNDWFLKTRGILQLFEDEARFHLMWDPEKIVDSISARQMLRYLAKSDDRVAEVRLGDDSYVKLEDKISKEAKDISEMGEELVLVG